MKDSDRRKLEKFERQKAFFAEYAAHFPAGSPGADVAAINSAVVAEMRELAGNEIYDETASRETTDDKSDLLGGMMKLLRNINRAANAFEEEIPGTNRMFRLPRNRSEKNLLATANSFLTDAEPLRKIFIDYGLDATFLNDLRNYIANIETSGQRGDEKTEERVESISGNSDAAARGMKNSRRADAVVRIKFGDEPEKLAAWTIASHLERAAKK